MDRKKPRGSSGVLAALLISPRTFSFCVCPGCMRNLYYTYVGESCPGCGTRITPEYHVEGEIPDADGNLIDFRAEAHEPRRREGAALPHASRGRKGRKRNGGRRRSGKFRPEATVREHVAARQTIGRCGRVEGACRRRGLIPPRQNRQCANPAGFRIHSRRSRARCHAPLVFHLTSNN